MMRYLKQGRGIAAHAMHQAGVQAAGALGSLGLAGLHGRQALHQLRVVRLPQQPRPHLLCKVQSCTLEGQRQTNST